MLPHQLHDICRDFLQLHIRPHPPENVDGCGSPEGVHVFLELLQLSPHLLIAVVLDDVVDETGVQEAPVGVEELKDLLGACGTADLGDVVHEPAEVLRLEGHGEEGDEGEEVGHVRLFLLHVVFGQVQDVVELGTQSIHSLHCSRDIHLDIWS